MELIDPLMKWIVAPLTALVAWMLKRLYTMATEIDSIEAQITWAATTEVYRTDPVLNAVAEAKGITPEQVDAMYGI